MNKIISKVLSFLGIGGSSGGFPFFIVALAIVFGVLTYFVVRRTCVKKINEELVKDFSMPTDTHVQKGMKLISRAPLVASIIVALTFAVIGFIK